MTNPEDDRYLAWGIEILKKCRHGIAPNERDMHNLEYAVEIVDEMYQSTQLDDEAIDESW